MSIQNSAAIREKLIKDLSLDLVGPMPSLLNDLRGNGHEKEAEELKLKQEVEAINEAVKTEVKRKYTKLRLMSPF